MIRGLKKHHKTLKEYITYKGDCLDIMPTLNEKSIDLVLADLPYGTTNCSWDSIIPLDKLWTQYKRLIKDNGVILLFAQTPFDKILGCSNIKMLKYEWIWNKTQPTGHLNANKAPMKSHENILVFYNKQPIYNPQKTYGHTRKVSTAHHKRNSNQGEIYNKHVNYKDYDSTERFPIDILTFKSDKQVEAYHPTQKPVELLRYLIRTYTNKGDIVLDNTMGSGSTGVACNYEDRRFIGIEKEQKYFDIANNRLEQPIQKDLF